MSRCGDDWETSYLEEWEEQQYESAAVEYWYDYYYEMMMAEIENEQYAIACYGAIYQDYDVPNPFDC